MPYFRPVFLSLFSIYIIFSTYSIVIVNLIIFTRHWKTISNTEPVARHFIWLGDAVYAKNNTIAGLVEAFTNLTADHYYKDFKSSNIAIDGIWDDHDYGVNDAGRQITQQLDRKQIFASFISGDEVLIGNNGRNTTSSAIIESTGTSLDVPLYHERNLSLDGVRIKVIFLDTRSYRDSHWIRSVGEFHLPFAALIASSLRGLYSTLGLGRSHDGAVLGEEQWLWLQKTLTQARADATATATDVTIIASSIQLLTSNPVFESWGHFPREKRRLFELIQSTDPPGLMFISGDVHCGEFSQAKLMREDGTITDLVEVTSSGLTHTCADSRINSFLCPLMMRLFSFHRLTPESFYIGKNFGSMSVVHSSGGGSSCSCSSSSSSSSNCSSDDMSSTCQNDGGESSDDGRVAEKVLRVSIQSIDGVGSRRSKTPSTNFETEAVMSYDLKLPIGNQSSSQIVGYEYADFYTIPVHYLAILGAILLVIVSLIYHRYISKKKPIR